MAKKKESEDQASRAISKFRLSDALIMIFITLLCLTCILPILHVFSKSVSSNSAVLARTVTFWPKGFNLDAYISIFKDGSLTYSMGFSVVVTLLFTVLGMTACTCAAYPLSRSRLKGRTVISFILMVPMYFTAGLIPTYLLYNDLNIFDTMWVLILPLIYSPYNMLIMKTSLQSSIPDALEESAFLDGASNVTILLKIVLPLSKPIIATLSLFYAVGRWNSYADNQYYTRSTDLQLIQYKLSLMVSSASEAQTTSLSEAANVTSTPEVLQAAAIMFATIPIIIIYPFLQKYFVHGAMIGSVKG